jgi:uncharacterized membrane protein
MFIVKLVISMIAVVAFIKIISLVRVSLKSGQFDKQRQDITGMAVLLLGILAIAVYLHKSERQRRN